MVFFHVNTIFILKHRSEHESTAADQANGRIIEWLFSIAMVLQNIPFLV